MKKTLRRFAPVALVLLGLATLSFMAKDSITLRLHPQQGKTYSINSKANIMTMMELQGQSMNMSQSMETKQTFTTKEVTDDQSTFETQIDALKLTVSQMGMKLEYDSEHPEKNSPMLAEQTKDLDEVIGKSTTIQYDNLGKAIDTISLTMSQLGGVILEFPEEELGVGSTWTSDKAQSVSGTDINAKMTYTVTAISKKSVDVSFTGVVDANSNEMNGTYEGTANIDPKTGLITKSTTKSNISMTINEQGMSIPMTMVGNTTITVEEK